jgi:uncharacterized membrane protein YeaQ/YmgE (transglycosylase-associated protein family)
MAGIPELVEQAAQSAEQAAVGRGRAGGSRAGRGRSGRLLGLFGTSAAQHFSDRQRAERDHQRFGDVAAGNVGSIVGGLIFSAFGASGVTGLNIYSLIVSVIGAVVVL